MAKMDAGFFKRGKNYQIRRVVPGDLQLLLNREEILKSLRTCDEAEAIRRYRSEATKIDDYFKQQRQLMETARSPLLAVGHNRFNGRLEGASMLPRKSTVLSAFEPSVGRTESALL